MADARSQHHELTAHEVVVLLGVDPTTGLSEAEVHERRERFGRNVLPAPRRPDQPVMTAAVVRRIITVGALMMIGAFGDFQVPVSVGLSLEESRTVVVSAFVAMEIGHLFNCRVLDRSVLTVGLFSNRPLLWGVVSRIALQLGHLR